MDKINWNRNRPIKAIEKYWLNIDIYIELFVRSIQFDVYITGILLNVGFYWNLSPILLWGNELTKCAEIFNWNKYCLSNFGSNLIKITGRLNNFSWRSEYKKSMKKALVQNRPFSCDLYLKILSYSCFRSGPTFIKKDKIWRIKKILTLLWT